MSSTTKSSTPVVLGYQIKYETSSLYISLNEASCCSVPLQCGYNGLNVYKRLLLELMAWRPETFKYWLIVEHQYIQYLMYVAWLGTLSPKRQS